MSRTRAAEMAANNLRRIWESKKRELNVTQADAAQKLGWTQGAFSQYLNNITELSPQAVIKLANFLEIDPELIDPSITPYTPNFSSKDVRFKWSSNAKVSKGVSVNFDNHVDSFCICVDAALNKVIPKDALAVVCEESKLKTVKRSTKNELVWAVQMEANSPFTILSTKELAGKTPAKKFVIISLQLI